MKRLTSFINCESFTSVRSIRMKLEGIEAWNLAFFPFQASDPWTVFGSLRFDESIVIRLSNSINCESFTSVRSMRMKQHEGEDEKMTFSLKSYFIFHFFAKILSSSWSARNSLPIDVTFVEIGEIHIFDDFFRIQRAISEFLIFWSLWPERLVFGTLDPWTMPGSFRFQYRKSFVRYSSSSVMKGELIWNFTSKL